MPTYASNLPSVTRCTEWYVWEWFPSHSHANHSCVRTPYMYISYAASFDPVYVVHARMFFFFNDTATTEIYALSLHDALPISFDSVVGWGSLLSPRTHHITITMSLPHHQDRNLIRLYSHLTWISYADICFQPSISDSLYGMVCLGVVSITFACESLVRAYTVHVYLICSFI